MRSLLLILLLFLSTALFPQIDGQKLDSLSKAIEAKHRSVRAWQDSFTRHQHKPAAAPGSADSKTDPAGYRIWIVAGVVLLTGLLLATRRKRPS